MKKKKGKYLKKNNPPFLWIYLIPVALIISLLFITINRDEEPKTILGEEVSESEHSADSIAIPGYEMIVLDANTKKQTTALQNPIQNCCLFKITLLLEDGTVLWKSDYIKPGEISDVIVLSQELNPGSYPNSVLKYECFTIDGVHSPLNGAETKLTLLLE